MNCKMPELKRALEKAGFTDVRTVISSGNAVFTAPSSRGPRAESRLEKKCEAAMKRYMGREFKTIVRSIDDLEALLGADPFARMKLPANAKCNVTFLREAPAAKPKLPVKLRGAQLVSLEGREALSYYVPLRTDPAFMVMLERTLGKVITTRTWETVGRVVKAARA